MKFTAIGILLFLLLFFTNNQISGQPLSGVKTIGGSSPNYATLTDAVYALTTLGINGPVTFNIRSDTLNEQVSIPEISGGGPDDTITFQSESGNPEDVVITYSASGSGDNYVIKLNGADYLVIQNITIQAQGLSYGTAVLLDNGAENNTFRKNRILGVETTSNSDNMSVILSDYGSPNNNGNEFDGNTIEYGSIGINCEGYTTRTTGTIIQGNTILNQYRRSIECNNQDGMSIYDNYIQSDANNPLYYGLAIFTSNNSEIKNNNIQRTHSSGGYGILIYQCSGSGVVRVVNNFIHINSNTSSQVGIKSDNNSNVQFYFNSINLTGNSASGKSFHIINLHSGITIKNNILANKANGYICYFETSSDITSDYNNLYATGSLYCYWNQEYADLPSWTTGVSKDQNSISVDPYFWSDSDLHAANTALQSGEKISGIDYDIDGDVRIDPPCIGADDFAYPALGGSYTIGASGDFTSFGNAVDALVNGGVRSAVIFNVAPDTYSEHIILPAINNSSETNNITFQSAGLDSSSVILGFSPMTGSDDYIIRFNGSANISFKSITIRSEGTDYGTVIELFNGPENISFTNCRIEGSVSPTLLTGILINGSGNWVGDNIHIKNCILKNGTEGIYLQGISGGAATGCMIQENEFLDQSEAGIQLRRMDAARIEDNYLYTNTTEGYDGIWLFYCDSTIQINKNRFNVPGSTESFGIYLFYSNGSSGYSGIISNNYLNLNIGTGGLGAYGLITWNSTFQTISSNTIVITGSKSSSRTIDINAGCSDINVLNNILSNFDGGYAYYSAVTTGLNSNHNNLYTSGFNLGYWDGADKTDLSAWQTASGLDANSVSVDPQFTAADDPHFPNPLLNDAGTPVAEVIDDIDGEMRDSTAPDIGADEFCLPPEAENIFGCTMRDIPELTAVGDSILWYSDGALTTMVHSGNNFPTGHAAAGTYTYYATQIINESESKADTVMLTINTTPGLPSATVERTCFGKPVPDLEATGTDLKWYDDEALTNQVHAGSPFATGETNPGTYTYYVTQTSPEGCESDPDTSVLTINPIPPAPANTNYSSCYAKTVPDLIAHGEIIRWYTDEALKNLVFMGDTFVTGHTEPGYYIYYLTQVVNTCESDPGIDTLRIKPRPDVPLADSQSVCIGENIPDLMATGINIIWYGDANHEFLLHFGNTYSTGKTEIGVYPYYVTQTDNGCESLNKLVTLAINGLPDPFVLEDKMFCEVDTQEFQLSATAAATGHSYSWISSQGDLTSSEANPLVKPTNPGSYTYILTETIDSTGCLDSDSVTITIQPDPMATVLADQVLCHSEIRSFQIGASAIAGNSYSWVSNPAGFVNTEANPTVTPTESITYILTETVDLTGCEKTDSVTFTINPNPDATVLADQTICHSEIQEFSLGAASVAGNSYSWVSNPAGFTSTQSNPKVTPQVTTAYTLTETINATGCDNTDSVIITINPNPVVSITVDQNPIDHDSSTTLNASGAQSYVWSPVTGLSSTTGSQVTADPDEITTYVVEGTNSFGCTATDTIILYVYCPECGDETYFTATGNFNFGCKNNLYKNNLACSWTILPSGIDTIYLNFDIASFDIKQDDYIKVYNGQDATKPLIGEYNNNNLPPANIKGKNALHIRFITDADTTGTGFQAKWSNIPFIVGEFNPQLKEQFRIYPNPASDRLFIESYAVKGKSIRVFVYNNLGQMMISQKWENSGGQIREELDISGFRAGMYLIRIVNSEDIYTQKVIKE